MTKKVPKIVERPIEWPRADPELLRKFDPRTKQCTMNCGPHCKDPRTSAERKFLCDECIPTDELHDLR
jgi:hypothetical protein